MTANEVREIMGIIGSREKINELIYAAAITGHDYIFYNDKIENSTIEGLRMDGFSVKPDKDGEEYVWKISWA